MSPKKLTDDDKQEILQLYRQTSETTSTLAERYGVSSSTISRFLKNQLSEAEYEELIQQKRLARISKPEESPLLEMLDNVQPPTIITVASPAKPNRPTKAKRLTQDVEVLLKDKSESDNINVLGDVIALGEMLGEDLIDLDDEDDDELDEDDEDWEDDGELDYLQSLPKEGKIQVLPLSAASFPKICYLVIDRTAELITRPLKEFAHLGKIPTEETQQRTLPVFDNHRVARRFSNRSQRVIKVPDGLLLQKTCSYLYAKGITRILMDGQIYSLSSL